MKKRFGMCVIGLWLMALNGFGQATAEPLPPLEVGDMPRGRADLQRAHELMETGMDTSDIDLVE